jgi:hypothetical protein
VKEPDFSGKILISTKMGKRAQKYGFWTYGFWTFTQISVIIFLLEMTLNCVLVM